MDYLAGRIDALLVRHAKIIFLAKLLKSEKSIVESSLHFLFGVGNKYRYFFHVRMCCKKK